MKVNVNSETGVLRTVIVGTAEDRGEIKYLNNPKYAEIVKNGTDPNEQTLVKEVDHFCDVLSSFDVEVLRPDNVKGHGQIFCRDIGFAIGDNFFYGKMRLENRVRELAGISTITQNFANVHIPPEEAIIEGGDIVVWGDYVFVGLGDRTNNAGIDFLKEILGESKEVIGLPLRVTKEGATNIVHLDCAFQPVGLESAIIYRDAFITKPESILDIFGDDNLIDVSQKEMYDMIPNIFSIHPELVVVEESSDRLSHELSKRNIQPFAIPYGNVAKLGGSLRCSTCPLNRDDL